MSNETQVTPSYEVSAPTLSVNAEYLCSLATRNLEECAVVGEELAIAVDDLICGEKLAGFKVVSQGEKDGKGKPLYRIYRASRFAELQRQAKCHEESIKANVDADNKRAEWRLQEETIADCLKWLRANRPKLVAAIGEKQLGVMVNDCVRNIDVAPEALLKLLQRENLI